VGLVGRSVGGAGLTPGRAVRWGREMSGEAGYRGSDVGWIEVRCGVW